MKTFISWNVNGIRSCAEKGLFEFLQKERPHFLCLQETKAQPEQLSPAFTAPPGYRAGFASAKRRGYSGVAIYFREDFPAPLSLEPLGVEEFDEEGRTLIAEYPEFTLICAYFPNSQSEGKRLDYKLRFCEAILTRCTEIVRAGGHVILCGDYNIAHKSIDLAHPKANEGNPGYLPEERAWMDKWTQSGYVDIFRSFCSEPRRYTWWSYRSNARANNVGWRIDYFCCDQGLFPRIKEALILPEITGSDHCPVLIRAQV
ncbi:MAG: exodeoxyribonuclease III [Spirochaetales bacterium]|nr:exodeoxyribonuclease III [Spirochaetales bacterium]